jgi:hypothetical protein
MRSAPPGTCPSFPAAGDADPAQGRPWVMEWRAAPRAHHLGTTRSRVGSSVELLYRLWRRRFYGAPLLASLSFVLSAGAVGTLSMSPTSVVLQWCEIWSRGSGAVGDLGGGVVVVQWWWCRTQAVMPLRPLCRMDLPGPTTSVGTRTDYSVAPWDYSTCVARHLMA